MMSNLRTALLSAVTIGLILGLVGPVFAQESDAIYIANGVVARVRTPGPYENLYQRSAAIDQAIAEVISTQDTQHPQVRVAMKSGKWSVYSGTVRIISVYPEEAKTNGISAKALAQIWAKNIKIRLPLTTPKSKMPPGAVLPAVEIHALRPAVQAGSTEAPPGTGEASSSMSRSAALLLTIDAFNVTRALSEEDYLARREEIARNLLKNLRPFMGGAAPTVEPTPAPVEPVTGREEVGPPAPAPVQEPEPAAPAEEVEGGVKKPGEAALPEVSVETTAVPPGHEDPAYAKVPQKNRIKTKFALIQDPYLALVASDPEGAATVGELLKAARAARAAEKFDECESYLDHAISLLGLRTG